VPRRKTIPPSENKDDAPQRFTPDDIVRAIEAVEKAGLHIDGVEITVTGDIKIATRRPRGEKSGVASDTNSADTQAHAKSVKK
jgi:hypothetical protein